MESNARKGIESEDNTNLWRLAMEDTTKLVTTESSGNNGKDSRGRFLPGNKLAHGNLWSLAMQKWRREFDACLTSEDFRAVYNVLLKEAKGGDLKAVKMFLSYTIGLPP